MSQILHGRQKMKKRVILIFTFSLVFLILSFSFTVENLLFYNHSAVYAAAKADFKIPVLSYHSIDENTQDDYVVTPEHFDRQMRWLHDQGYTTITMQQFDLLMRGKAKNNGKYILITFDDGYADNYTQALPILNKYGFKATLFLITNWVNGGAFLSWDQVKQLKQTGWDIMSHTRTHPYLPLHSFQTQLGEIIGSKQAIEKRLSTKVNVMAYPYGFRSGETVKILSENGYSYAFTFDEGWTTSSQNPFLLKRLFVSGKEDMPEFERKMEMKPTDEL